MNPYIDERERFVFNPDNEPAAEVLHLLHLLAATHRVVECQQRLHRGKGVYSVEARERRREHKSIEKIVWF